MGAGAVNGVFGILDSVVTGVKQSTLKNTRALRMNWELALGHSADDIFNKDWYKKSINKTEKNAENLTKRQAARAESGKATREAVRTGRKSGRPEKENVVQNAINRVSETKEEVVKKTKQGGEETVKRKFNVKSPSVNTAEFKLNPKAKNMGIDITDEFAVNETIKQTMEDYASGERSHVKKAVDKLQEMDLKNAKKTSDGGFWDNATTWAGEHPIGTAAAIAGGAFGIGLMVGDDND